jgi:hypothetical protein
MSGLALALSFERNRWCARGGGVDVEHRELRGLEALLETLLADETPVDVELAFDMAALPRWLHQFHGHYCNYTLRVPPRSACA